MTRTHKRLENKIRKLITKNGKVKASDVDGPIKVVQGVLRGMKDLKKIDTEYVTYRSGGGWVDVWGFKQ